MILGLGPSPSRGVGWYISSAYQCLHLLVIIIIIADNNLSLISDFNNVMRQQQPTNPEKASELEPIKFRQFLKKEAK